MKENPIISIPLIKLITRRSLVQIQPPLPSTFKGLEDIGCSSSPFFVPFSNGIYSNVEQRVFFLSHVPAFAFVLPTSGSWLSSEVRQTHRVYASSSAWLKSPYSSTLKEFEYGLPSMKILPVVSLKSQSIPSFGQASDLTTGPGEAPLVCSQALHGRA